MKYNIHTLGGREQFRLPLERELNRIGWTSCYVTEKVNGAHVSSLERNRLAHGYEINWCSAQGPRVGHLGIWYTVLNSLEAAPVVTFEDDSILGDNFAINWTLRSAQFPEDTDFFSLFLPRDSDHLYTEELAVSSRLTRTYQRYGGVSMYYTEQGVDKIKWLLSRDGITNQYDDQLYAYSKSGELNGYCSKPSLPDLVYITGQEESIVQESEYYERV